MEAMPLVYIYDLKTKDKKKLRLKPEWVKGLPVARGQWGFGTGATYKIEAHVAVRTGGGMEVELFMATVLSYVALYTRTLHPTFVWEGEKLIKGPIFIKTDSAVGCQAKSEINIQF